MCPQILNSEPLPERGLSNHSAMQSVRLHPEAAPGAPCRDWLSGFPSKGNGRAHARENGP